jgi:NodT family efflux transporter outer membrane factor (OMF) lipoprotein
MKNLTHFLLITSALSFAGCSSSGDGSYDRSVVETAANVPAAWSTALSENVKGPENWLQEFADPKLMALIKEGQNNNLDLKMAAGNMDTAWLLAEKSGVALQPNVNLAINGGQSGSVDGGGSTSSFGVGLQVDWELDVWGRIRSGSTAAEAQAQASQADYLFAKHSLSANIAKTYFKVIEAKLQAKITTENLAVLEKTMNITQVKYDNGLLTGQDVAVNKVNLANASEQLITTQSAKREAIRALEVLLGRYPDASLDIPDVLPDLPAPPPVDLPSSVLERRPDIIAAERQVAAAYSATDQAKAAQLPRFSLSGNLGGSSDSLSNVLSPSNVAWQLASNLLVPLFDGGARKIDVDIANVEQQQALDNYRKSALSAFSEIEQNLDNGHDFASREKALNEAYLESEKALKIANIRYQEGENELLDTLQIQQQAMSAKSSLLSIKRSQLEQRVNLYLALGGSW